MKKLTDLTMQRIDNVRIALNRSQSDWAINYWNSVLVYLLRLGNRLN